MSAGAAAMSLPSPGTRVTFACCRGDRINTSLASVLWQNERSLELHFQCFVFNPADAYVLKCAKKTGDRHRISMRWTSVTSGWWKSFHCVVTHSFKLPYVATARLKFGESTSPPHAPGEYACHFQGRALFKLHLKLLKPSNKAGEAAEEHSEEAGRAYRGRQAFITNKPGAVPRDRGRTSIIRRLHRTERGTLQAH